MNYKLSHLMQNKKQFTGLQVAILRASGSENCFPVMNALTY